jgi:two-component system, sensor histidine kinase LadS
LKLILRLSTFFLLVSQAFASDTIILQPDQNQYTASYEFIDILEDRERALSIHDVSSTAYRSQFRPNKEQLPRNYHTKSVYWVRYTVRNQSNVNTKWLQEFYDSSIEKLSLFLPDGQGGFTEYKAGNTLDFSNKKVQHKNFVFFLPDFYGQEMTYYARVESHHLNFMLSVVRSYERFSFYALNEYYFLGIFYGLILMMAIYNFFIFFTTRDWTYLWYVLYVVSNALYSMSQDGTGFQYIWGSMPEINPYVSSVSLFLMVMWMLLYTETFLSLRTLAPAFFKILNFIIIFRIIVFVAEFSLVPDLKNTMFFDGAPLIFSYIAAILALRKGFVPARYFVVGVTMLFIGFVVSNLTVNSMFGISVPNNIFTVYCFNFGTVVQMMFLSFALADRIRVMKQEKDEAQIQIIKQLRENEELKDNINRELEQKVNERTAEVMHQNEEIEKQSKRIEYLYKEVTDSIETSKVIQQSILPSENVIKLFLPNFFVLYKPKDIVSGDFYWFHVKQSKVYVAAVDCTGHGVAGAFMSLIGYNLLNQIMKEKSNLSAADVLTKLNADVIKTLHQDEQGALSREGMDIALCVIDMAQKKIEFSGGNNPLYHIRNKEITVFKADRNSIGIQRGGRVATFTNQELDFQRGDMIYIFSDGYAGQIGGDDGAQKFMYPRFREMLVNISDQSMPEQKEALSSAIDTWKKDQEQLDDILVMGFRF